MPIFAAQNIEAYQPDVAVKVHNDYRRLQNSSNMKALQWDEGLADETATYALKCDFNHDSNSVDGENIYMTTKTFDTTGTLMGAITAWHKEEKDYDFSTNKCAPGEVCGHYTQMVWANSRRIGCAVASCPSVKNAFDDNRGGTLVFCRYSPAGNVAGVSPFKQGKRCSECDSEWGCENGLCVPAETPSPKPETKPGLQPTTVGVASTVAASSETTASTSTKFIPPLTKPTKAQTEYSQATTATTNVPSPATTSATKEPITAKPHFTSPKPTTTSTEPPFSTGTSTASPPRWSCSEEYVRILRDYTALMEDYKKDLNKWREMTSVYSCSHNE